MIKDVLKDDGKDRCACGRSRHLGKQPVPRVQQQASETAFGTLQKYAPAATGQGNTAEDFLGIQRMSGKALGASLA